MKVTPMEASNIRCPKKMPTAYRLTTQESNCVAGNCMAWRWVEDELRCGKCQTVYLGKEKHCIRDGCGTELDILRSGYCGLAGGVL